MSQLFLGIDPGLTGAVALSSRAGLHECADLPICANGTDSGSMRNWLDVKRFDHLLREWSARWSFAANAVFVIVERPMPMPSLPAQTIAAQFDTFGAIRGAVAAHAWGASVWHPNPRAWKRRFGLKGGKDEKNASRECAQRIFPGAADTFKRVKDHNRAEAALLARWGELELA